MSKPIHKKILFQAFAVAVFVVGMGSVSAASESEVRELCFDQLKENMKEVGIFRQGFFHLEEKKYKALEAQFSPYYRNMSSFGIDLSSPLFDLRLYDWGDQTGYIHPPEGPYPVTKKSDQWESPTKQHIYAEEFIRDEKGKRHFLGCGYFYMDGDDLMDITRDRYLYDGDLVSVVKETENAKIWYNENMSFDLENKPLVTWKRMFVYPKETENPYFNRYRIMDAMPSNKVDTFEDLFGVNEAGDGVTYIAYGSFGEIVATSNPVLMPVKWEENKILHFNSYYQAIEFAFPKIEQHLSIHGALSYDSFKRLMTNRKETAQSSIWNVVADIRDIKRYYIQKQKGELKTERPLYEVLLNQIPTAEAKVSEVIDYYKRPELYTYNQLPPSIDDLKAMDDEHLAREERKAQMKLWVYFGTGVLATLALVGLVLFLRRKKDAK